MWALKGVNLLETCLVVSDLTSLSRCVRLSLSLSLTLSVCVRACVIQVSMSAHVS